MSPLEEWHPMTIDEWLALDDGPEELRHELVGGRFHAITGGSRRHSRLILRMGRLLDDAAVDDGCIAYPSDAGLVVDEAGYFPDAMVLCDETDSDPLHVTSPCLVVEILSPSTRTIDQREKLAAYTSIPSLETYLLVEAEERLIVAHQRRGDLWAVTEFRTGDSIELSCPRFEMAVDDVYRDILD